jgi:thiol-disulfide isomerase/thioredoxin
MKYLLLGSLLFLAACYGKTPEKTGLEGRQLASFDLLLTDSSTVFNTRDIPTGKPFILFVFDPHCPYSKAQIQSIVDEMKKLKNINLYIFGIAPLKEIKDFSTHYNLSQYNNITIGQDQKNMYGQYMNITGVPYIAIYDKDKKLKNSFTGVTDIDIIKEIASEN